MKAANTLNPNRVIKNSTVSYKHFVNSGDLISAMPGMKSVFESTGKKAVIMQRIGMPGQYYLNAVHPLTNEFGVQVTMTMKQWQMLVPLLEAQDYVESCEIWEGQPADVDLNLSREGAYTTMAFGQIQRWNWYVWPALACDLSKAWIKTDKLEGYKGKVLLNFTERYRNHIITYYFLKKYEDRLLFAGTKGEHELFCKQNNLTIPYLEVENFYELACVINSVDFNLGCQSMVYNIAEGLKVPRIVEVCREASNCIPVGEHAYDFLHQEPLEFYVEKLMKEL